jgi:hypothetical protein
MSPLRHIPNVKAAGKYPNIRSCKGAAQSLVGELQTPIRAQEIHE